MRRDAGADLAVTLHRPPACPQVDAVVVLITVQPQRGKARSQRRRRGESIEESHVAPVAAALGRPDRVCAARGDLSVVVRVCIHFEHFTIGEQLRGDLG